MSKPVIAIDMGGTKIKIGIVHQDTILASASIDSYSGEGLRRRLPLIKEIVDKLLERAEIPITSVSGLGISSPGIVDNHRKRILSVDKKFGDAPDINLEEWCLLTFGIPFFIENDARSALLGEWKYGNAKDADNVILMTLGTGIGSAAVTEGRLLRGKHFTAGIMGGHFVINYKGSLCNCGNKGCVETEASTWNITNIAKSEKSYTKSRLADFPVIDYELIFRLAGEGDATAIHLRDQSLQAWSASAINLIHAYDPEILVLTGGIMASSAHIIPYIRKQVETHAWTPWGKVDIREGKFPATAALLGIAHVVNNG
ncbi:ROK family protein [Elizabethkingia anophelis]|uniref:ROK family protein n=1 Tax=Elizabethkingia anophelis TaxID=1117645 RepID=UPI0013703C01|nr:ROK family protein [Elizabethkingia anophelis]MCT4123577.1 ROK family protein [Elizabethkingia anophelis]MYY42526.1 ROK family protein [Elizabethkingia anophelis]